MVRRQGHNSRSPIVKGSLSAKLQQAQTNRAAVGGAANRAVLGRGNARLNARNTTAIVQQRPAGIAPTANGHTLVLMQEVADKRTRTWSDFNSLTAALDSFVSSYEKQLRQLNPQVTSLSYTVHDLHVYIDSLHDLSAMVFDSNTKQYAPRGKPFIKNKLLERLKSAAVN